MCEPDDYLPYVEFAGIFPEVDDFCALAGVPFGAPGHDWCARAAEELRAEWRAEG